MQKTPDTGQQHILERTDHQGATLTGGHVYRLLNLLAAIGISISQSTINHWIGLLGYWAVLLGVMTESTGIPFPGETILLVAAAYAGVTHHLSIAGVIAAAAAGAIIGDNFGYAIGRYGGYRLIARFGHYIHFEPERLHVTERYFARHGDKTVFLGRFVSVLRTWVAFFAGVNRMHWRTFLFWNALGGCTWATVYGLAAYFAGRNLARIQHALDYVAIGGGIVIAALIAGGIIRYVITQRQRTAIARQENIAARDHQPGTRKARVKTADRNTPYQRTWSGQPPSTQPPLTNHPPSAKEPITNKEPLSDISTPVAIGVGGLIIVLLTIIGMIAYRPDNDQANQPY